MATATKARLGAHVSVAGGFANAIERSAALDAGAQQIFVKSARQWKAKPIPDEQAEAYREAAQQSGLADYTLAHASYLINLASPDEPTRKRSLTALQDELARCRTLSVPMLVLHPGSHVGDGEEVGLQRIADGLKRALDAVDGVDVLLENTAGQGTNLGADFAHLGALIDAVQSPRLGVCIDTCHAYAAGFDLATPPGYKKMVAAMEANFELDRIRGFHLNDSKHPLDSRRDRHEHIGAGCIGLDGFAPLMRDRRFRGVPMVLETPKKSEADDLENLERLRSLLPKSAR